MLSVHSLLNNKKILENYIFICIFFFFFSFEHPACWGGKWKHRWKLNRIELAMCSSSGEVKSYCWFTKPGQQFCSTTRLQIASRAAEGATAFSCQAANPGSFNFPNESSLITSCARAWFLSISSSINFKRQSRTWRWGAFHVTAEVMQFILKKVKVLGYIRN